MSAEPVARMNSEKGLKPMQLTSAVCASALDVMPAGVCDGSLHQHQLCCCCCLCVCVFVCVWHVCVRVGVCVEMPLLRPDWVFVLGSHGSWLQEPDCAWGEVGKQADLVHKIWSAGCTRVYSSCSCQACNRVWREGEGGAQGGYLGVVYPR